MACHPAQLGLPCATCNSSLTPDRLVLFDVGTVAAFRHAMTLVVVALG